MTTESQYQSNQMPINQPVSKAVTNFNSAARDLFFGWVLSLSNDKSVAQEAGKILADPTKLLAHIPQDIKEDFCVLLMQATKTIGVPKSRSRKKLIH